MVALVRRQLEVVTDGETAELRSLEDTWDKLVGEAPSDPPAAAAPLLAEAAALTERTRSQLLRMHAALQHDAGVAAQASRAARGYATQVSRVHRIDRGA
jgi:hypothetical protein